MPMDYSWIIKTDIAHRGLYKSGTKYEENSLAAIERAVEKGYAIEIDVRMTAEGAIVVFHDARLERLTDGRGYVSEFTYAELEKYTVGQTGLKIPLLTDVLDLVNERVPLIIEAKCPLSMDPFQLCAGIRFALEGYIGKIAVMSFNPKVALWFRDNFPDYARGLVIDFQGLSKFHRRLLTSYSLRRTNPHFLALDINSLPSKFAEKWRSSDKPLLTWTVKSKGQETVARENADALIFEAPAVAGTLDDGTP
ncbi:glycerophosphodiester phosphodiesterase family protein [Temperatibacter marinus]|uniref:Glycerophosphodiester phosphodiesterase family protein n=1 Tax=Temperatibacter marinus TaxID=1456591 RepID=A0AA52EHM4_9PROT|nr:glycerophosphodiester phosphodiesterase family protein [Temperatibacter marinus]WND02474.1 glycerophosphodiester phosphodiesterase family protein [Temperatibacter marinus]